MTLVMIVHDIANGVQQLFVVLLELFLQREVGPIYWLWSLRVRLKT